MDAQGKLVGACRSVAAVATLLVAVAISVLAALLWWWRFLHENRRRRRRRWQHRRRCGATEVLVVTGSTPAGCDAESTMNAIAATNTAITAAARSHHRDRLRRGGTTIVVGSGSGTASTRVGGRAGGPMRPASAARISSALANRHPGSRAIARSITAASAGSTSGPQHRQRRGVSLGDGAGQLGQVLLRECPAAGERFVADDPDRIQVVGDATPVCPRSGRRTDTPWCRRSGPSACGRCLHSSRCRSRPPSRHPMRRTRCSQA